jgi:hypothetical protein
MKKVMTAAFVLFALAFAATAITAQAEKQSAIPSRAVSAVLVYCRWEGFGDRCCENWLDSRGPKAPFTGPRRRRLSIAGLERLRQVRCGAPDRLAGMPAAPSMFRCPSSPT